MNDGGKVEKCPIQELYPIIEEHVSKDATVYTDGFKTCDGLVNFGYRKHYRVKDRFYAGLRLDGEVVPATAA